MKKYTPGSGAGPANMDMKKRAAASKLANMKNANRLKKKMDTTGFMSVEDVKKAKKAGTFKDWTSKYGKNN